MNKTKKQTISMLLFGVFSILIITTGITFAYFTATITGNETETTITVTGGSMKIIYNDSSGSVINLSYISPQDLPLATKTFTVTGNSNTDLNMLYNMCIEVTLNTFLSDALKYKLTSINTDNNGVVVPSNTELEQIPTGPKSIFLGNANFEGNTSGNKVHTYILEFYFPNTEYSQDENQEKEISAYIRVEEGKKLFLGDLILGSYGGASNIVEAPPELFASISAGNENSMYKMNDDYGPSYYYRGSKSRVNSYAIFAEHQWKIIRINGDGSIRMIYNGICPNNSCSMIRDGSATFIDSLGYNESQRDTKYLGYMYGDYPVYTIVRIEAEANEISSIVKNSVDNWYVTNIINKNYHSYVSDTLFCNDRQLQSEVGGPATGPGVGREATLYAGNYRLVTNKNPILTCGRKHDSFTVSDTELGNGALDYPIGLITADELAITGMIAGTHNFSNHLYISSSYFTMTLGNMNNGATASVFVTGGENAQTIPSSLNYARGIRGVISLKSDVIATGTGNEYDPYIIQ